MKITVEEIGHNEEEEIIVRFHNISDETLRFLQNLKNSRNGIIGTKGDSIRRIKLEDIYYFEVVDNKSFIYCKNDVYESKMKLYEFEQLSNGSDFFRAAKSMVLNANKIDSISPALSGRFQVKLLNNEEVVVSRQYVKELKKLMGI